MDGLCLFLRFHHFVHPWFFSVCAPFLHHHPLHLSFSFWANFTILDSSWPSESQIDELGKWNFVRCTFLVKSDYDQTESWLRVFAMGQLFFFFFFHGTDFCISYRKLRKHESGKKWKKSCRSACGEEKTKYWIVIWSELTIRDKKWKLQTTFSVTLCTWWQVSVFIDMITTGSKIFLSFF